MPVLVWWTANKKWRCLQLCSQHFLHCIFVYGKNFRFSRASNSKANSPIWPKIMPVLVICKFKEDLIKNEDVRAVTTFSHCKSIGDFGCRRNHSFDPICPKTLCSLFPTLMMLPIKFDKDWPIGFWKCGCPTWWQTDDGPLLYYKLAWAKKLKADISKSSEAWFSLSWRSWISLSWLDSRGGCIVAVWNMRFILCRCL